MTGTLAAFSDFWRHAGLTPEAHLRVYQEFQERALADVALMAHRRFVAERSHVFGAEGFYHLWRLAVATLPREFRFLEVGVHGGQTLSLVAKLAEWTDQRAEVVGVSTFDGRGLGAGENDSWVFPPDGHDYLPVVRHLFNDLGLPAPTLVPGDSTDPVVIASLTTSASLTGTFDCVYIDGGHSFEVVTSDIRHYAPLVPPGGLLVADDCACGLNFPVGYYCGIAPACAAVDALLPPLGPAALGPTAWEHLGSVLHVRVWRRVS